MMLTRGTQDHEIVAVTWEHPGDPGAGGASGPIIDVATWKLSNGESVRTTCPA